MKRRINPFDRADIPVLGLILGIILLTYGGSELIAGLGPLIAGVVIILYIRPLRGWWSKD
jgi:uncharacterized membrane protein YdjX (TVP38/TMEM64 family)